MEEQKRRSRPTKQEIKKQKRKKTVLIGFVFTVMVLVGFVQISKFGIQTTVDVLTGKNQTDTYTELIAPLVLMDPVPFDEPSKLDEKIRIQTGIWSIIMNGDTEKYGKDESDLMLMPAVDIEAEAIRLFGPNQTFTHESFGDYSGTFYYDDTVKSYKIPITGRVGYSPQITKISAVDKFTRLTVDYVSNDTWSGDNKGNKINQSEKTMYYYLDKDKNQPFVTKIEVVNLESGVVEETK